MQISTQVKDILKQVWKNKLMAPRVQTFAWRLLRKALPTGLRASRFSVHISKQCCRCDQDENEMHLFFLCDFARAAWFGHPWYTKTDILVQNHISMQSLIHALLNMQHPYASIPTIFNFMWCIWKSRNDCLFARKCSLPHQVHIAAAALLDQNISLVNSSDPAQVNDQNHNQGTRNVMPFQGCTLRTDLLVTGAKIYSDACYKCSKIPGLVQGTRATGIGVFLNFLQDQNDIQVQIQASARITQSPL